MIRRPPRSTLDRASAASDVYKRQVLGDVPYGIDNTMKAAYQPQLSAAVCAACHQDKNDPDEDGDFEEANGVVSEPTYQEWLLSLIHI